MVQKVASKEDVLEENAEIGCMCVKCNCNTKALLVTSICDSCLRGKHTQNRIYN